MTVKPKRPSMYDANFRLPEDLTQTVVAQLQQLTPSVKTDYLLEQLLSKFVSKDTAPSSVRRQRALNKWLATEMNNEATNDRLLTVDEEYNILPRVTYMSFMTTVQRIIEDVIGCVVPLEALNGGFSGGATTSKKRTESHPGQKYIGKADATARNLDLAESVIADSPIWTEMRLGDQVSVVQGNILFTVPKSTEIDRCACKEPDLNMYLQKGAGNYIRRRLKLFGIDLNDQSRNQSLARKGSLDGSLATIDLSSASDSISRELVFQTLPVLWFTHLDGLRCPQTVIDGEVHVNEMFSSMGNGFTFELESLLFYAIARAVAYHRGVSGVLSVYGDDIIVPTQIAHELISVLAFLGFETNKDKSFTEGPFRESCGGHFHNGRDITPIYIRKPIEFLVDVIHLANSLRRWAHDEDFVILDPEVEEVWQSLAAQVPKCYWGGVDTQDKARLVSAFKPDNPKKLVPVTRDESLGDGGYLLWLDVTEQREVVGEPMTGSTRKITTTRYRSRPVRFPFYTVMDAVFSHEINAPESLPQ